jgi:hypothetical protein
MIVNFFDRTIQSVLFSFCHRSTIVEMETEHKLFIDRYYICINNGIIYMYMYSVRAYWVDVLIIHNIHTCTCNIYNTYLALSDLIYARG